MSVEHREPAIERGEPADEDRPADPDLEEAQDAPPSAPYVDAERRDGYPEENAGEDVPPLAEDTPGPAVPGQE